MSEQFLQRVSVTCSFCGRGCTMPQTICPGCHHRPDVPRMMCDCMQCLARPLEMNLAGWFWLSFADPDKPKGEQYLGVVIVQGINPRDAHMRSHELGLNPGGEMIAMRMDHEPDEQYVNRILTEAEARELGDAVTRTPKGLRPRDV